MWARLGMWLAEALAKIALLIYIFRQGQKEEQNKTLTEEQHATKKANEAKRRLDTDPKFAKRVRDRYTRKPVSGSGPADPDAS